MRTGCQLPDDYQQQSPCTVCVLFAGLWKCAIWPTSGLILSKNVAHGKLQAPVCSAVFLLQWPARIVLF